MDLSTFSILTLDGITSGAVYALLALALVIVFSVTRVIYIPQGEWVAFGALTMAALQTGAFPQTATLLLALALCAFLQQAWSSLRAGISNLPSVLGLAFVKFVIYPASVFALAKWTAPNTWPMLAQIGLTLAIVAPMGPIIYRLAFQPLAQSSTLLLLIVAVAVHFAFTGIGLVMFGAEGSRTTAFSDTLFEFGAVMISAQSLLIIGVALALILALFLYFGHTFSGKALRATAVNRRGAQLVGIGTQQAGRRAFTLASIIGTLCGVLIAPLTTVYYDSGFLIGLKGFVGAIVGGLGSYPIAAAGAVLVGVLESFSSYWASAFKEVIVFTLIIPVLLWRSLATASSTHDGDGDADADGAQADAMTATSASTARHFKLLLATIALLGAAILLLPLPAYWITLGNYIGLSSIVALGLVLLTGVAGLTSFGQAAFVGLGAYTTAYLSTTYGLSPWLGLMCGVLITACSAFMLGAISMRLSGHFLPLGTIAWGLSLYFLFGNLEFLGKHDGINGIPSIMLFQWDLGDGRRMFCLIWSIVGGATLALRQLLNSRSGRAIRALKGGALMAQAMGVNTAWMKICVFVIAAVLASISGWLYAHMQRAVNPSPFGLTAGIEYLFMAVVGGAGHVWGALLGAGVLTILKDQLQSLLPLLFGSNGSYDMIVFGILLIVLLQHASAGLWPLLLRNRWLMHVLPGSLQARAPAMAPHRTLALRVKPQAGQVLLEVEHAHKQFGGIKAVHDMSFSVRAGDIIGLIGPNGAGKSTMFNLLSGVATLTSGAIRFCVDGALTRIDALPSRTIAQLGIGRTFQHVQLLPSMSVLENVALGAHLRAHKGIVASIAGLDRQEESALLFEAQRQLERVGLGALLYREAGTLALGQQRLLEIARALCGDPSLLLLDEPAAGLRYLEKQALSALLKKLKTEGMAILIVEHDMDFVMNLTDALVVMEFGSKIAEGLAHDVQNNPAVLAAYLGGID